MNGQTTAILFMVFLAGIAALFLTFMVIGLRSAYRNGVRDGYQNTWLPHVREQIKEERLTQGAKVEE